MRKVLTILRSKWLVPAFLYAAVIVAMALLWINRGEPL